MLTFRLVGAASTDRQENRDARERTDSGDSRNVTSREHRQQSGPHTLSDEDTGHDPSRPEPCGDRNERQASRDLHRADPSNDGRRERSGVAVLPEIGNQVHGARGMGKVAREESDREDPEDGMP